jgi:hypothetical protein
MLPSMQGMPSYVVAAADGAPGLIMVVSPEPLMKVAELTLNSGENSPGCIMVDTDGSTYVGLMTSPGQIVHVSAPAVSTTVSITRLGSISLGVGLDKLSTGAIDYVLRQAFFTTATSPITVVRVDLQTFSYVDSLTLTIPDAAALYSMAAPPSVPEREGVVISPGAIARINCSTNEQTGVSLMSDAASALATGFPITITLTAGVVDQRTNAVYSCARTTLGVMMINVGRGGGAPKYFAASKEYSTGYMDTQSSCVWFGGKAGALATANVNTWTAMSKTWTMAGIGSADLISSAVDSAGGYGYFGTSVDSASNNGYLARVTLDCLRMSPSPSPAGAAMSSLPTPTVSPSRAAAAASPSGSAAASASPSGSGMPASLSGTATASNTASSTVSVSATMSASGTRSSAGTASITATATPSAVSATSTGTPSATASASHGVRTLPVLRVPYRLRLPNTTASTVDSVNGVIDRLVNGGAALSLLRSAVAKAAKLSYNRTVIVGITASVPGLAARHMDWASGCNRLPQPATMFNTSTGSRSLQATSGSCVGTAGSMPALSSLSLADSTTLTSAEVASGGGPVLEVSTAVFVSECDVTAGSTLDAAASTAAAALRTELSGRGSYASSVASSAASEAGFSASSSMAVASSFTTADVAVASVVAPAVASSVASAPAPGGGISGGAVAGIIIGLLALAALGGALFVMQRNRTRAARSSVFAAGLRQSPAVTYINPASDAKRAESSKRAVAPSGGMVANPLSQQGAGRDSAVVVAMGSAAAAGGMGADGFGSNGGGRPSHMGVDSGHSAAPGAPLAVPNNRAGFSPVKPSKRAHSAH